MCWHIGLSQVHGGLQIAGEHTLPSYFLDIARQSPFLQISLHHVKLVLLFQEMVSPKNTLATLTALADQPGAFGLFE